jgi:hypothetical protein
VKGKTVTVRAALVVMLLWGLASAAAFGRARERRTQGLV